MRNLGYETARFVGSFVPGLNVPIFASYFADAAKEFKENTNIKTASLGLLAGLPFWGRAGKAMSEAVKWDIPYMKAIKAGNIAEAQRLRDLHFMDKAPNTIVKKTLYHGTNSDFKTFDASKGITYKGVWLAESKDIANRYGKNTKSIYANFENPTTYIINSDDQPNGFIGGDGTYYTSNTNLLKSKDAITYDDAGNIIPLSQRDNFNVNDIRYSIDNSNNNFQNKNYVQMWKDGVQNGYDEARDFLNSILHKQVNDRNKRYARMKGYGNIVTNDNAENFLKVPYRNIDIKRIGNDKNGLTIGAEITKEFNPKDDELMINYLNSNSHQNSRHEALHRGNFGEYGERTVPDSEEGLQEYQNTKRLYKEFAEKVIKSQSEDERAQYLIDYMLDNHHKGEPATNMFDLGRAMRIKPGSKYPGKEKLIEMLKKHEQGAKSEFINTLNMDNPKYVWRALNGTLWGGTGVVLYNNKNKLRY